MRLKEISTKAVNRVMESKAAFAIGNFSLCRQHLAALAHFLEVELKSMPDLPAGPEKQSDEQKEDTAVEDDRPSPKAEHQAGDAPRPHEDS